MKVKVKKEIDVFGMQQALQCFFTLIIKEISFQSFSFKVGLLLWLTQPSFFLSVHPIEKEKKKQWLFLQLLLDT